MRVRFPLPALHISTIGGNALLYYLKELDLFGFNIFLYYICVIKQESNLIKHMKYLFTFIILTLVWFKTYSQTLTFSIGDERTEISFLTESTDGIDMTDVVKENKSRQRLYSEKKGIYYVVNTFPLVHKNKFAVEFNALDSGVYTLNVDNLETLKLNGYYLYTINNKRESDNELFESHTFTAKRAGKYSFEFYLDKEVITSLHGKVNVDNDNMLNVTTDSEYTINVYSTSGILILRDTSYHKGTYSLLKKGVYLVSLTTEGKKFSGKININ